MTDADQAHSNRPFSVLFICTANQCRSPIAEHLFRAELDHIGLHWTVSSAGTNARGERPMEPRAAELLTERGLSIDGFASTRVTPELLNGADLILTAEAAHRHAVVTLAPGTVRRTFTVLGFARLLELGDGPGPELFEGLEPPLGVGVGLIESAMAARAEPQARRSQSAGIPDPVGGSTATFREAVDLIDGALRVISLSARRAWSTALSVQRSARSN